MTNKKDNSYVPLKEHSIDCLIWLCACSLFAVGLALSMLVLNKYNEIIQVTPYAILLYILGLVITPLCFWLNMNNSEEYPLFKKKLGKVFSLKYSYKFYCLLVVTLVLFELALNQGTQFGDFIFFAIGVEAYMGMLKAKVL